MELCIQDFASRSLPDQDAVRVNETTTTTKLQETSRLNRKAKRKKRRS
jgi:hypothetical protein